MDISKVFYYILHSFNDCNDKDIIWSRNKSTGVCEKCGRFIIGWKVN